MHELHILDAPHVIARASLALDESARAYGVNGEAFALGRTADALTPLAALCMGLATHELALLAGKAAATRTLALLVGEHQLLVWRAHTDAAEPSLVGRTCIAASDDAQRAPLGPLWAPGAAMQLAAARISPPRLWAMCSLVRSAKGAAGRGAEIILTVGGPVARRSTGGLVSAGGRLAVASCRTPDVHRAELAEAWAAVESV